MHALVVLDSTRTIGRSATCVFGATSGSEHSAPAGAGNVDCTRATTPLICRPPNLWVDHPTGQAVAPRYTWRAVDLFRSCVGRGKEHEPPSRVKFGSHPFCSSPYSNWQSSERRRPAERPRFLVRACGLWLPLRCCHIDRFNSSFVVYLRNINQPKRSRPDLLLDAEVGRYALRGYVH
jgi:hypothetical protein